MHRFNWTTILVVTDVRPTILAVTGAVHQAMITMLRSNLTLVKIDGSDPQVDYVDIMRKLHLQTRGQLVAYKSLLEVEGTQIQKSILIALAIRSRHSLFAVILYITSGGTLRKLLVCMYF